MVQLKDCICDLNEIDNESASLWTDTPDALGCPYHGPRAKQYCRKHHNGFYGGCHPCLYDQQLVALGRLIEMLVDRFYGS